jgi:transcriptional regulator with XRE-family HTH domain
MEPETQRLITLLRSTLRVLGLSNREVAFRLGMSPSYLSKLFAGVSDLRLDHVIRICRAAELEPAEFFNLAYPRQPANSRAARKLRELLTAFQAPPQPARAAPPPEDERQVEDLLREMLEKVLGRKRESA